MIPAYKLRLACQFRSFITGYQSFTPYRLPEQAERKKLFLQSLHQASELEI